MWIQVSRLGSSWTIRFIYKVFVVSHKPYNLVYRSHTMYTVVYRCMQTSSGIDLLCMTLHTSCRSSEISPNALSSRACLSRLDHNCKLCMEQCWKTVISVLWRVHANHSHQDEHKSYPQQGQVQPLVMNDWYFQQPGNHAHHPFWFCFAWWLIVLAF